MRYIIIAFILFYSCSSKRTYDDNVKDVYLNYLFLTKFKVDSFQVKQKIDSLLKVNDLDSTDLSQFISDLESDIDMRNEVFREYESKLDSNLFYNSLFTIYNESK